METEATRKIHISPKWFFALILPLLGISAFYLLRDDQALMDLWVSRIMAPAEQFLGRMWSMFPFSVAEVLIALAITAIVVWLIRAIVLLILQRAPRDFLRRMLALVSTALWIWCSLCWCWNASYYAPSFAEKSGLTSRGYTPSALLYTTLWFADQAAELSDQVQRDGEGHFAEDQSDYFQRGVAVYDNLVEEFPFLEIPSIQTKPLFFSRLQSIMGFTGVHFPFTGEANVNINAPACLRPATIAHEMAHQRMVASEDEANFVGIAAAVSSDDVVFQYSGYLFGLIQLSNALHDISPDAWYSVIDLCFTDELRTDWNDNYHYWQDLRSPVEEVVEEVAEQTYDSFLKGNGQALGIASYGACVDLLITYFLPHALEFPEVF